MKLTTSASLWAIGLLAAAGVFGAPERSFQQRQAGLKFNYASEKVRGVNIGGWLLSEPWITPSLYADWPSGDPVRDEYTLTQVLGKDAALARLKAHWDSFITAADFSQIAAAGMNHVRIPIGYWSVVPVDGEPYVQGAYDYMRRALDWAQQAGLKVLIDVHSAPGSQNGFDNSGRLGAVTWMTPPSTIEHQLSVIRKLGNDFGSHPAVASIELLNEPMGPLLDVGQLEQFYLNGWTALEGKGVSTAFSDAFLGVSRWTGFANDRPGMLVDVHHYQVFDGQVAAPPDAQVAVACGFGSQMTLGGAKPVVCGEWSAALTDCARWLNGLGRGARYDGTFGGFAATGSCERKASGSVAGLTEDERTNMRKYIEAQLDSYEKGAGWVFWTWKTEGAPEWDMHDLLANGVFPQPLTERRFPGQC